MSIAWLSDNVSSFMLPEKLADNDSVFLTNITWTDNSIDQGVLMEYNENFTEPNSSVNDVIIATINSTEQYSEWMDQTLLATVIVSTLLTFIIVATIVGNVFVIASIILEKNLQTVGNYLVMSLAVADLMVALLVMPLGAVYEVRHEWILGPELCEIWTSGDVLCCTASILHLVAIALDRFWAVTNVDYVRNRSGKRIGAMIFVVWAAGFLVSLAPVFGWKDVDFTHRVETEKRCLVSQDIGYQVFATCCTFYVPLVIILILYWRIYQVARKRIRHKPGSKSSVVQPKISTITVMSHDSVAAQQTVPDASANVSAAPSTSSATINGTAPTAPGCATQNTGTVEVIKVTPQQEIKKKKKLSRESVEAKRERKAAKTLAIITGVFVICWLPFFLMALLMALCSTVCEPDPYLFSFFLWLGYVNSMLNPIIYTIFSPDFRNAFKKRMLCGVRANQNGRR